MGSEIEDIEEHLSYLEAEEPREDEPGGPIAGGPIAGICRFSSARKTTKKGQTDVDEENIDVPMRNLVAKIDEKRGTSIELNEDGHYFIKLETGVHEAFKEGGTSAICWPGRQWKDFVPKTRVTRMKRKRGHGTASGQAWRHKSFGTLLSPDNPFVKIAECRVKGKTSIRRIYVLKQIDSKRGPLDEGTWGQLIAGGVSTFTIKGIKEQAIAFIGKLE